MIMFLKNSNEKIWIRVNVNFEKGVIIVFDLFLGAPLHSIFHKLIDLIWDGIFNVFSRDDIINVDHSWTWVVFSRNGISYTFDGILLLPSKDEDETIESIWKEIYMKRSKKEIPNERFNLDRRIMLGDETFGYKLRDYFLGDTICCTLNEAIKLVEEHGADNVKVSEHEGPKSISYRPGKNPLRNGWYNSQTKESKSWPADATGDFFLV
jgi:hypothetical protein